MIDFINIFNDDFNFFAHYSMNLDYDLFQSKFNLHTNYNHIYYYNSSLNTISIKKIYFDLIYTNPFLMKLDINFNHKISFFLSDRAAYPYYDNFIYVVSTIKDVLVNDIEYTNYFTIIYSFYKLWENTTYFEQDFIFPTGHPPLKIDINFTMFQLLLGDNFSRFLNLNMFFQRNEFIYLNLNHYKLPFYSDIDVNTMSFLHLFVWKELFYEHGVESYAYCHNEIQYVDKEYPLNLGYFQPIFTAMYSDNYTLPISLNFFSNWDYWLSYKNTFELNDILTDEVNSIWFYHISYRIFFFFFNYHYPSSFNWSDNDLIQYIYSSYYSDNYLIIWCSIIVLIYAILRFIFYVCLNILYLFLWIINIQYVINKRSKYLNFWKRNLNIVLKIVLKFLWDNLEKLHEMIARNYIYDVLLFKPFWATQKTLMFIFINYNMNLRHNVNDHHKKIKMTERKLSRWFYRYVLRIYWILISQFILAYLFRYTYFFLCFVYFTCINTLFRLATKSLPVALFVIYIFYVRKYTIWLFINIFNWNWLYLLWTAYIKSLNVFLLWLFYRYHYIVGQGITAYFLNDITHYYRKDTYFYFPLRHAPIIKKIFTFFYSITDYIKEEIENKNTYKFKIYKIFFIDFIFIIIFKFLDFIKFILFNLLSFKYKYIYKLILYLFKIKYNILDNILNNKWINNFIILLAIWFISYFSFYFSILLLLVYISKYINILIYFYKIKNIFQNIINFNFFILGSIFYFIIFIFCSLCRYTFLILFYIIIKLKYLWIFIILYNYGIDFHMIYDFITFFYVDLPLDYLFDGLKHIIHSYYKYIWLWTNDYIYFKWFILDSFKVSLRLDNDAIDAFTNWKTWRKMYKNEDNLLKDEILSDYKRYGVWTIYKTIYHLPNFYYQYKRSTFIRDLWIGPLAVFHNNALIFLMPFWFFFQILIKMHLFIGYYLGLVWLYKVPSFIFWLKIPKYIFFFLYKVNFIDYYISIIQNYIWFFSEYLRISLIFIYKNYNIFNYITIHNLKYFLNHVLGYYSIRSLGDWNEEYYILYVKMIILFKSYIYIFKTIYLFFDCLLLDITDLYDKLFSKSEIESLWQTIYLVVYNLRYYFNIDLFISDYRFDLFKINKLTHSKIEPVQDEDYYWTPFHQPWWYHRAKWQSLLNMILLKSECCLPRGIFFYSDWEELFFVFLWFNHSFTNIYFFVWLSIIFHGFILNFFFKFGDRTFNNYYNNNYLWSLFRSNKINDDFNWLKDNNDIMLLNNYTNQFLSTDINKDTLTDKTESKIHPSILKGVLSYITYIKNYKHKVKVSFNRVLNNKTILFDNIKQNKKDIKRKHKEFKHLYKQLTETEKKYVNKLISDSLLYNYESSVTFDYKRFIYDPNFNDYYGTRYTYFQRIVLFLAFGFSKNELLSLIYLNDSETDTIPFDLLEVIEDDVLKGYHKFNNWLIKMDDLVYGGLSPRWFFIKDPSTSGVGRSSIITLAQDTYSIQPEAWIFDGGWIYMCMLPGYWLMIFEVYFGWELYMHPNNEEYWFIVCTVLQDFFYPLDFNQLNLFAHLRLTGDIGLASAQLDDSDHPLNIEYLRLINPWFTHNQVHNSWEQGRPCYYVFHDWDLSWYAQQYDTITMPLRHFIRYLMDYSSIHVCSPILYYIHLIKFAISLLFFLIFLIYNYKLKIKITALKNKRKNLFKIKII